METETTRQGLKERWDASQVPASSGELLNPLLLQASLTKREKAMPLLHLGCGYNSRKRGGMSAKHSVFVLGIDGKPLTPTTNAKARKLMKGSQAKPVWNKFGRFGIQMLKEVGTETPKTAFGVDFGTKFEGYAVAVGDENNLAVMWKLPDKKKIVRKLKERSHLRRARRFRNCRRRACRFDNRKKDGFIAPSQLVIIQSRLKAMNEFFKCFPIDCVALEDVRFNHRDKHWGKNFSTIEIGKNKINKWIRDRAYLQMYNGYDTQALRDEYGYKKSGIKNAEVFNSHCSDALAIATDIFAKKHIEQGDFLVVDDTYRCKRRRLHDTQPAKGGIREAYSTGSFKGIIKGTICEYGQICGGTEDKNDKNKYIFWIRNSDNKIIGRTHIKWLSHKFKTKTGEAIPLQPKLTKFQDVVSLPYKR